MSRHQFNSLISLIPQSQLACDGFAISLLWIYRHFWPGVLEKNLACLKDNDYLRLLDHFWESGGHRVTFNSDLKPGAAFLIAICSPINRSMPGRCLVGHRTYPAKFWFTKIIHIYQSDAGQTSLATRQAHYR